MRTRLPTEPKKTNARAENNKIKINRTTDNRHKLISSDSFC